MSNIEKLEFVLKLMKARKHDTTGLGAPMLIISEVLETMKQVDCTRPTVLPKETGADSFDVML